MRNKLLLLKGKILKNVPKIVLLLIAVSCNFKKVVPPHTDAFRTVDKKTGDITIFYGFKDIDTAIFYAKKDKQNILVAFGGYAVEKNWETLICFNDADFINNHFKILWLAVDNRQKAKDTTQTVFWYNKIRTLYTIGDQNKYFEETVFDHATQPFYCFIDTLKRPVGKTISYDRTTKAIKEFINSGLRK